MVFVVRQRKDRGGVITVDINVLLPNGERYRERRKAPIQTRTAAAKWAAMREQEIITHWSKPTKSQAPTLGEFAERWINEYAIANQHKPSGVEHKRLMLSAHLSHLSDTRIDKIGQQDIARIKAKFAAEGKAPKTVNNVLVVLSRILASAVEWGLIESAPQIKLLRVERKAMQFYSFDHYDRLVEAARVVGARAFAVVVLAGDVGLRRGEILALQWSDIDTERRLVTVQRSTVGKHTGATKGNAARYAPLTALVIDALDALPRNGARILPGLNPHEVRSLVSAAEEIAGLPITGKIHVLRHTYASHLVQMGESLYKLQSALGHKDATTTQNYSHLNTESLGSLARLIDKRRGT